MKKGQGLRRPTVALLSLGLFLAFSASMMAQVQSETTTTSGISTKEVSVERGEVVYVSGNDLIVKGENGQIRHFSNVPESARVTVDGKELGIHDLKVGMKLQRTITTTTTPKLITTVQTVTGTVFHVLPPTSVILTLENGKNQQFKIPKGQKFEVDGQMKDAFELQKGMKISATKITEVPETTVSIQREVTGELPTPPPTAPILVAVARPVPVPQPVIQETAAEEPAPENLPATASYFPAIGLLGALLLALGFGLRAIRLSGS